MTARDPSTLEVRLRDWIGRTLGAVDDLRMAAAEGGASSETYLVAASLGPARRRVAWVLRIEPRGHQVYQDPSVARQYAVIEALSAIAGLPIPAPIAFEAHPDVLGAPFFLMERAAGEAPPNDYHRAGILQHATRREREAMWRESIDLLARLDTVPAERLAFLAYGTEPDGIVQERARWAAYRAWANCPELAVYDRADEWLASRQPAAGVGFAWGDARLPNILFHGGRVSALLDWETASLGGAESDLGWWLFYDAMISDEEGVERLPGLGDGPRTIAAWEAAAGRKARNIEWHLVFAAYRFALISERARALAIAAGRLPPDQWGLANPAVRLLERLLADHGG